MRFFAGVAQVALGVAIAWILVTAVYESSDWIEDTWQKVLLSRWKKRTSKGSSNAT